MGSNCLSQGFLPIGRLIYILLGTCQQGVANKEKRDFCALYVEILFKPLFCLFSVLLLYEGTVNSYQY